MNKDTETLATDAIQAHERLHLNLRQSVPKTSDTFQKSIQTLDLLREIKARVDGSSVDFDEPCVKEEPLQELRQLVLMHVPDSITGEVKDKFNKLIVEAFENTGQKILCAVLLTCPWYQATQNERGEQARHNVLFVVYLSHDHQFLAPVNQHVLDEAFVYDKEYTSLSGMIKLKAIGILDVILQFLDQNSLLVIGSLLDWLYAVELYPFVYFLTKGKSRCLEVLYCTEQAQLYCDEQWRRLQTVLDYKLVTSLRGFVEACKGQSVSGIGKKGKDGKFRLKESTTFHQFCDSYRLQHHLYNISLGLPMCIALKDDSCLPDVAKKGFQMLHQLYKNPDVLKKDIFDILVQWRDSTVNNMKGFKFTDHVEVENIVGKWQHDIRLHGRNIAVHKPIEDDHSTLIKIMEEVGGPVSKLSFDQILCVARAGSYLYGLSTPTSDVDYLIIYMEPTQNILSRCKEIKDNFENRGPTKEIEYGAYEARLFCEMLLKGSIIILELIFSDGLEYMSPLWKSLSKDRQSFVTEKAIQQYLGILRNNYSILQNEKHKGTPRDRKLFYQIFHKEDCVRNLMKGEVPNVRCTGELQDFIMKVRTKPLEGSFSREALMDLVKSKIDNLLQDLADRPSRLKENMDYNLVTQWLLSVRGIQSP